MTRKPLIHGALTLSLLLMAACQPSGSPTQPGSSQTPNPQASSSPGTEPSTNPSGQPSTNPSGEPQANPRTSGLRHHSDHGPFWNASGRHQSSGLD